MSTFSSTNQFIHKVLKTIDNKDQVEKIVKDNQQAINEKDEHGDTLLHFASRIHNLPIMSLLIQHGADPEAINEHGRRPIHEAIDSLECLVFLIQTCHVDVNAMKRGDWTPVMIA
ncbi:ankyrin repeat-containing domain protein [Cokeromyces recurvatus]|uniref:ankyrin repeat-containing domain protein n=1 Tax=Cokeromyces recurvatus TaxID=90255 RepID=UPI00221FDEAF|nr:ankyrin repeat-containing domain protein [Cokeromyces recurvatus]KAI7903176.1 ankyrin repeat-containing domain protein [Cokeromyces recurvatus]